VFLSFFFHFKPDFKYSCLSLSDKVRIKPGAAPRGVSGGGTVPPFLTKVIFVNRLKPMRKYWRYGGMTSPTIFKFQPDFVTSVFKDWI